jgi:hypothetical protein
MKCARQRDAPSTTHGSVKSFAGEAYYDDGQQSQRHNRQDGTDTEIASRFEQVKLRALTGFGGADSRHARKLRQLLILRPIARELDASSSFP